MLDGYPDPDTVLFGNIILRISKVNIDIHMTTDLVGHAIEIRPRVMFLPNTTYELLVTRKLATLDGRHPTDDLVFPIHVGGDLAPPPAAAPAPTWTELQPTLSGCAPFCHSRIDQHGAAREPYRQLDLTSDPTDPKYGIVRVRSIGSTEIGLSDERVVPFDASRSVLLRKLIGGDHRLATNDPPYPQMRVAGRRMPLNLDLRDPAAPPLDEAFLAKLQAWINAGAPTP